MGTQFICNNEFGYDILLITANWPASRRLHLRQLLLARAIENQCYVVGVNRLGKDGNGWQYAERLHFGYTRRQDGFGRENDRDDIILQNLVKRTCTIPQVVSFCYGRG